MSNYKTNRRIKTFGGQKTTLPIKDPKELESFIYYFLNKRSKAKSEIKKYQADRNWMLVLIGLNTAFRAEDLLQLRVVDVIKGYVSIIENKTKKPQHFRMRKEFHQDILNYIERNNLGDYDYMFLGQKKVQDGKVYPHPITRQQGHKIISEAAKEVGIPYTIGLHSLRKTFGYMYIKYGGGNWQTLSKMYNHNDIPTTQLYVMWDLEDAQKDRSQIYIGNYHK